MLRNKKHISLGPQNWPPPPWNQSLDCLIVRVILFSTWANISSFFLNHKQQFQELLNKLISRFIKTTTVQWQVMVDFRCKHPIFILNTESGPAFADMNTKPKQNRARSELNKHDIFCPCHNTTRQNRYGNWKCSFLWIFFIHLERFWAYVFMAVANFCRIPIF